MVPVDLNGISMDYREALGHLSERYKQTTLADMLGTSQSRVSSWLKGAEPRASAIEKIKALAEKEGLAEENGSGPVIPSEGGDVANLDVRAGMGGGGFQIITMDGPRIAPEHMAGSWAFPDEVKAIWRSLPNTFAFRVVGDSMEPTLQSGSYVFVDTSERDPALSDIYALDYGDGLMVKRVEYIARTDKARVFGDNPAYQAYEMPRADLHVAGRVVAWFQWRG